ncbi:MAG: replication initiation protein [Sphingobacteriaceae bacterium]|jgi:plasmid replication initiation protein
MKPKRHYNKQPNIITKSTDDMTLIEKRIMYLVINQLDTGFNIRPDLFKNMEFQIPFSKLHETNYNRIKSAVKKLQFRALTLIDDDDKEEFLRIIPFPSVSIKGGLITLKMMADVVPYFLEIRKGFTKYELAAALALTSVYAQKLYELLSRWKDKKEWFVSLAELQTLLNATNYNYKDFRVRCLETGLNELNEKTDLVATYEVEKAGKSVSGIHFFIKMKANEAKETVEYELNQIRSMHPAEVAMYAKQVVYNYTFSEAQRQSILSDPILFEKFAELDSKFANGLLSARNPTAYIASILFIKK